MKNFYLTAIGLSCLGCFVVLLVPKFDQPRFIPLRGIMFVICGLLSGAPIIHIEYFLDNKYLNDFPSFPLAFGGALYIIGAIIYILKIPERLTPRAYDYIGSSHNILHCFVVAAALVHYNASIRYLHMRQMFQCPVPALERFSPAGFGL